MNKIQFKKQDNEWVRYVNGLPEPSTADWVINKKPPPSPPTPPKEQIKNKKYYQKHPEEDYCDDETYIHCELGVNCPNDDLFTGCVKTVKYKYASGKVKQEQTVEYRMLYNLYKNMSESESESESESDI